jgi:hypothetical protein
MTTRTSTVPAPTGATAVIDADELTVKSEEALEPKSTASAPVNPEPVMWMLSPPPAVPLEGVRDWTEDDVVVPLRVTPGFTDVVVVSDPAAVPLDDVTVAAGVVAARPVAGEP